MGERVVCVWRTVGAGCAVQARRQRLTVSPSQNPSQKSDGSRQTPIFNYFIGNA